MPDRELDSLSTCPDCGNGWTFDFQQRRVYCRTCEQIAKAAPDLLASVREFVALYDGGTRDVIGQSVREKLERADAAIAKAEGRA